jgi:hypothetical protein
MLNPGRETSYKWRLVFCCLGFIWQISTASNHSQRNWVTVVLEWLAGKGTRPYAEVLTPKERILRIESLL